MTRPPHLPAALLTVLAALGAPASADEAIVDRPIAAASLHDGPLDMVAYYLPAADGRLDVTATFASRDTGARPLRVTMALTDGDDVSFAMPGHLQALYRFARTGRELSVSVRTVDDPSS